ncbi:hypothetical protein L226DRAFT_520626 [Lentinus tigrinus ALCF2SS1-7]|uniref:uncharacterized protein n=1 Tax=Lentinus tigrinus ALCF2SS1-7 TaxID=1328758 RepID=UPI0011663C22|nr:hypothetical protein L226DRAFT_520626 [Lentinus tigrinus ALCF2SS1-7]
MQRRSSTSQMFQRMRKVSDPLIHAAHAAHALVSGGSNSKRAPDESFFEYDTTKGWHRPHGHRRPPDSGVRHGLSQRSRKISKEEITYPFLPSGDTLDLLVESATMSAERERENRLRRQNSTTTTSTQPERPPRPSLDERPPIVRDPQLRMQEQKVYKSMNNAKRPERPREEDLPYGAAGSIPRVFVKEERPPPPAAAVRGAGSRTQSMARSSTVPFPSSQSVNTRGEDSARASGVTRTTDRTALRPPEPTPAAAKVFTPFAPMARDRPPQDASSTHPVDARSGGPSYLAQASTSTQRLLDREYVPTPPPKDSKWMGASTHAPSAVPAYMRRQDGVRRVSSSGDVHLPPQHSRYHGSRDENDPRHPRAPAQELRTVKSTPLSARKQNVPVHPTTAPGLPSHPAIYLERAGSRTKPRHPDVPRDVSPDNPQRLPTPRRSEEEERPAPRSAHRHRERERGREHASATTARPQADVIHPGPHQEPEPENDRQKRRREKEKAGRSVEWYGMGSPIAWEIARALAEPEGVSPLPIDWNQFVANGQDYGTKPLETRKRREGERYRS